MSEDDNKQPQGLLSGLLDTLTRGVTNALEVARVGRLGEAVYQPYSIAHRTRMYRLRRYEVTEDPARGESQQPQCPVLLVPPLMLSSEIYDISPESSAVGLLRDAGVDTFVVDFGAPEEQEGGLTRTLDDHVLAISDAVDFVRELTGQDVHLSGYSQGGMFAYQCAAYRDSKGIASLITFGSPVNTHRNLPGVSADVATRFIDSMSGLVRLPMEMAESVPAQLSSGAFRLVSARKEVKQFVDFVTHLHDREAIQRGESSRRFLQGEGFVAWPGPAMRTFFEDFVVANRLSAGGFVIDGRSLTLADIECPILYFVGLTDDFARPPAVRGIREAAPNAELHEVTLRAGHFGLVVGSKSMNITWPTVVRWLLHHEGKAPLPGDIVDPRAGKSEVMEDVVEANFDDVEYSISLLKDTAKDTASSLMRRFSGTSSTLSAMFDNMRWQVPRLAKLERLHSGTQVSVGLELAKRAEEIPEHTFFLWRGRAHSYADANQRVTYVTAGLIECGVKRGDLVGVLMEARPTYLTVVAALSRLGAVSVLISPDERRVTIGAALKLVDVNRLVADPEHAALGRESFDGEVLVLGGGGDPRTLADGLIDMERIDPTKVKLPEWYEPNAGVASDLAMVMFTTAKDGQPRATRITNRRWAVGAYGAAAASTLTQSDTVYCCMPLHHAAGLLVSAGGALVGGSRLALSEGFEVERFWTDVRRYGASVVNYAGEMCRELVDAPATSGDRNNPIRLFAGSGMRRDVWRRLEERFDVGVLEFYATTEGNAVLANVSGKRTGSLGRALPGSADMALVHFDMRSGSLRRTADGWAERCFVDEPGMLIASIDGDHPLAALDGFLDEARSTRRVVRDVFSAGDAWLLTGDLLRKDAHGNYAFVDRAADMLDTGAGPRSSAHIEDAIYELFEVKRAVVYGQPLPGSEHQMPIATLVARPGYSLDPHTLARHIERKLDRDTRPLFLRVRDSVPLNVGFRPLKRPLRDDILQPDESNVLAYDPDAHAYVPMTPERYVQTVQAFGGNTKARKQRSSKPGSAPPRGRKAASKPPAKKAAKKKPGKSRKKKAPSTPQKDSK